MNYAMVADAKVEWTDLLNTQALWARSERPRYFQAEALTLLESMQMVQQALAHDLAQERSRRECAESAEREARQASAFKDDLLRDVNHRAKNSIQIAASLLSLQARAASSVEVRTTLMESYKRLTLLAKVHEILYLSVDNARDVPMSKVFAVMSDAFRLSVTEASANVRLHVTCEQIMLFADEAIPLALLTNEVITNAYKHAFPKEASGQITVALSCTPEGEIILEVTDNGVGMDVSNDEGGIGLKLVRSFAAQLCGHLVFSKSSDNGGTAIRYTFQRKQTPSVPRNVDAFSCSN